MLVVVIVVVIIISIIIIKKKQQQKVDSASEVLGPSTSQLPMNTTLNEQQPAFGNNDTPVEIEGTTYLSPTLTPAGVGNYEEIKEASELYDQKTLHDPSGNVYDEIKDGTGKMEQEKWDTIDPIPNGGMYDDIKDGSTVKDYEMGEIATNYE